MTAYPGSDVQPPAAQPPAEPEKKSGAKKWLSVAGTVAVVGGVAAVRFIGFGGGDPEVGDCLKMTSDTEYDAVDCGSAEAEYKIVGIEDDEMTYPDFEDAVAADTVCADFQSWEYALWTGDLETEPGTIYCAGPV
jgi:hypothetical protein